jgi:hypothetical protein
MLGILFIQAWNDDLIKYFKSQTVITYYNDFINLVILIEQLCTLLFIFFLIDTKDGFDVAIVFYVFYCCFSLRYAFIPNDKIKGNL